MNEAPHQNHNSAAEDESASPTDSPTIQHPMLATIQQWSIGIVFCSFGVLILVTLIVLPLRIFAPQHTDMWIIVWEWIRPVFFTSLGVFCASNWVEDYFYQKKRTYIYLLGAITMFLIAFTGL